MDAFSKKAREEAIEELLAHADGRIVTGQDPWPLTSVLAIRARDAVWKATNYAIIPGDIEEIAIDFIEAAALLRDGWSPGDPFPMYEPRA